MDREASKDKIKTELWENNKFFRESEEERYKKFKDIDPFPEIESSLLNSEDIIKYVMTAGMIEDFNIEDVNAATYSCKFSGQYIYWDEQKEEVSGTLKKQEELTLYPNSITFIAVKQYFRIPSYMILRFNLKVSHVYKGLLLGTGPIVDPGFVGQIYIPLHNLTSNEYIIKNDAYIIDVEFTKMSNNSRWDINENEELKRLIGDLNFKNVQYTCPDIKAGRLFIEYIQKALVKDELFHKKDVNRKSINSSVSDRIHGFEKQIDKFDQRLKSFTEKNDENNEKIRKDAERMEKTENYVKSFTFVAFLSVVLACFSLAWSVYPYLSNSTAVKLNDAEKKIEMQKQINDDAQKKYDKEASELRKRIEELEHRSK